MAAWGAPRPAAVAAALILTGVFAVPLMAQDRRVIVLGFDGADPARIEGWRREGVLPGLQSLAADGCLMPLKTTNPAESPVAWSTMITGMNPGRTGIYDFLRREPTAEGVRAELALTEVARRTFLLGGPLRWIAGLLTTLALAGAVFALRRRRARGRAAAAAAAVFLAGSIVTAVLACAVPAELPALRNLRGGEPFWKTADRAGIRSTVLFAPCDFPATPLRNGQCLSGLGVPDAAGTFGLWALYTNETLNRRATETGGRLVHVPWPQSGGASFPVEGPRDPFAEGRTDARLAADVRLEADAEGPGAVLSSGGHRTGIAAGGWSGDVPLRFSAGLLPSVRAVARFRALDLGARLRLYLDPPFLDPRDPPRVVPLSEPPEFVSELAARHGVFETTGWACATSALKDGAIDEATFLEDAWRVFAEQESVVMGTLARGGFGVFFAVFSLLDRVQHMLERHADPEHPAHDPAEAAARAGEIRRAYEAMDRVVARVLREHVRENDLLIVLSDHGSAPFRHAVSLNAFLAEQGYLVLARPAGPRDLRRHLGDADLLAEADLPRTRAHAFGLGQIWLHRRDRDPHGIVGEAERPALLAEIRDRLLSLRHEGRPVVRSATPGGTLYPHGDLLRIPDLVVGFERGFRVSWQCCLGGSAEPLLAPNLSSWSGDHCSVDPDLVPGFIGANRPLRASAAIEDVAPTILAHLGVAPPADVDGTSLLLP